MKISHNLNNIHLINIYLNLIQNMNYILTILSINIILSSFLCSCFFTFSEYISQYSKNYTINTAHYNTRQGYYQVSVDAATLISSVSYVVGENQYWDSSPEQRIKLIRSVKTIQNPSPNQLSEYKTGGTDQNSIADITSKNWTADNKITPVRNQNYCGSAWDFAVVAMAEASILLKEQQTYDLSQQQILECTTDSSCNGGYVEYALESSVNNGLSSEAAIPYTPLNPVSGVCDMKSNLTFPAGNFYQFYNLTDAQIISLLKFGPVVAQVSAQNWLYYKSGIFTCTDQSAVGHAVLLTGFTDNAWLAKNSWGQTWGQNGYIQISRTANANCGIGTAIYALHSHNIISYGLFAFVLILIIFAA